MAKPSGVLFDGQWRSACVVERIPRQEAQTMILTHYLGKWPGVCVLILGLRIAGILKGVIVYSLPPRETATRYGGLTWELGRLWLCDSVPKNAETFLIGKSVKYIRQRHPDVRHLVSYADPSAGHAGTIYKAANWRPDGRTDDDRKTPRFDYCDLDTGKKYARKGHIPASVRIGRIPRVSKFRFHYPL